MQKLEGEYVSKDRENHVIIKDLKEQLEEMEKKKIQFENEKVHVTDELSKVRVNLEEEIFRRLQFESKMNALHLVN